MPISQGYHEAIRLSPTVVAAQRGVVPLKHDASGMVGTPHEDARPVAMQVWFVAGHLEGKA